LGQRVAGYGLLSLLVYAIIWTVFIGGALEIKVSPRNGQAYYLESDHVLGFAVTGAAGRMLRYVKWFSVPSPQILSDWLVVRTRPKDRDAIVEHLKELYGDRFELKT